MDKEESDQYSYGAKKKWHQLFREYLYTGKCRALTEGGREGYQKIYSFRGTDH